MPSDTAVQIETAHTLWCRHWWSGPSRRVLMKLEWIAFALVVGASFVVLLGVGVRIYQEAPPIAHEIA